MTDDAQLHFNPLTVDAHCCHMGIAIKHSVPDRISPYSCSKFTSVFTAVNTQDSETFVQFCFTVFDIICWFNFN